MQKISILLIAIFGLLTTASAQNKTIPDVSDQLINTMHQYEVDVKALNRVYFVNASPEKRERYKRLANDYLSKICLGTFSVPDPGRQSGLCSF